MSLDSHCKRREVQILGQKDLGSRNVVVHLQLGLTHTFLCNLLVDESKLGLASGGRRGHQGNFGSREVEGHGPIGGWFSHGFASRTMAFDALGLGIEKGAVVRLGRSRHWGQGEEGMRPPNRGRRGTAVEYGVGLK